jgi:hypothetical protein
MSLKSRDIEELERKPFKEPPFARFLVASIQLLAKILPIKERMAESVGGLSGRIFRCWEKQEYEKATQIAIHALEKYRNKKSRFFYFMDHHNWWSFMKYGVDSAKHIKNEELRERLVQYANAGIKPLEGYDVAYSYLEFFRWKYDANSCDEAIKYAEVASRAGETWAEPDFILGWYGLLRSTGNGEAHLIRAIEKDQRVLFRIANNDVCRQHQHIINKLKAKYHVPGTNTGPNNAIDMDS